MAYRIRPIAPTPKAAPPANPDDLSRLKTIAAHLGVAESTVMAYSRLSVDPLPLFLRRGLLRADRRHLDEWKLRRTGGQGLTRHEGWQAIADALAVDRDTALQWAKLPHDPLPVMGRGTRKPWAYATAVRDWLTRHDLPVQTMRLLTARAEPATQNEAPQKQGRARRVAA